VRGRDERHDRRGLQDELAETIAVVHQVVERVQRVQARGGQHLEEALVLAVVGIGSPELWSMPRAAMASPTARGA
jgi:hypothetical protein